MYQKPALTTDDATRMLKAAEAEAQQNQWPVSLAVCDDGGHLLAFVRLPGAPLSSVKTSQAKARTAAITRRETKVTEDMINEGRTAFLSAPDLEGMLEGGVPILVDGHCVGAVGVSGVKSTQDAQVARAGIATLPSA